MNLLRIFRPTPPSIEDSARLLSEWKCLKDKERYKLRARQMNIDMGRPIPEALRR